MLGWPVSVIVCHAHSHTLYRIAYPLVIIIYVRPDHFIIASNGHVVPPFKLAAESEICSRQILRSLFIAWKFNFSLPLICSHCAVTWKDKIVLKICSSVDLDHAWPHLCWHWFIYMLSRVGRGLVSSMSTSKCRMLCVLRRQRMYARMIRSASKPSLILFIHQRAVCAVNAMFIRIILLFLSRDKCEMVPPAIERTHAIWMRLEQWKLRV